MGGAPTRVNSPMIQTLGQTTNFTITYDDAFGDARHRAEALQRTCEKDFSRLASWFGVSAGFGPSNRATLQVETQSLANNNGYRANGTIRCSLHHFDGAVDSARADDAVRALFVAEFAEVLMSYRNQTGAPAWNPAGSDGEGLSRVCAAVFYPDAYYDPAFLAGPFVNPWLTSSGRTDWVDSREASDVAIDSFGCSILFLYWLRPARPLVARHHHQGRRHPRGDVHGAHGQDRRVHGVHHAARRVLPDGQDARAEDRRPVPAARLVRP